MRNIEYGDVPLSEIELGERRREDYGDIDKLAEGIRRVGLLHPLIVQRVNGHYQVVVGGRRFKALQKLNVKSAPVRLYETLSEQELREIELEENENRKDLTARELRRTFKASRQIVDDAQRVSELISSESDQIKNTDSNPKGAGRKPKGTVSKANIAQFLGTSKTALIESEQHVETAEKFPFMQADQWRQSHVLAVREGLEALPEQERNDAANVLACAKLLDPASAVELVQNIAAKKPEEREAIYLLSKSEDPRDRSKALSSAAELPPMRDPRLNSIDTALAALGRASKPFPKDPLTPEFLEIITHLKRLRKQVEAVSYDARRATSRTEAVQ